MWKMVRLFNILFFLIFSINLRLSAATIRPLTGSHEYSSKALEREGKIYGVYYNKLINQNLLRARIQRTSVKYKYVANKNKLKKYDIALSYFFTPLNDFLVHLGATYTSAKESEINGVFALWFGPQFFSKKRRLGAGADLVYSNYPNYLPSSIYTRQFSPYLKLCLGDLRKGGWPHMHFKGHFVQKVSSSSTENSSLKTYESFEIMAQYNLATFHSSLSAWIGKRALVVNTTQLSIDNLSGVFIRGYGAMISKRIFNTRHFAKIEFNEDWFEATGTEEIGRRRIIVISLEFNV